MKDYLRISPHIKYDMLHPEIVRGIEKKLMVQDNEYTYQKKKMDKASFDEKFTSQLETTRKDKPKWTEKQRADL